MASDLVSVLIKLCSHGPVLYIGLLLAINPASVGRLAEMVMYAMHNFHRELRGFPWQQRLLGPEAVRVSKAWRIAIRVTGLTLAAYAFLSIAAPK
jgi:hypothetical protein